MFGGMELTTIFVLTKQKNMNTQNIIAAVEQLENSIQELQSSGENKKTLAKLLKMQSKFEKLVAEFENIYSTEL